MDEQESQRWHIQQAMQREIREMIALQGFAIRHVLSDGTTPAFGYTIGLHLAGHPELLISGLTLPVRTDWLLDLGFRVNGPPPRARRADLSKYTGRHESPPAIAADTERFELGVSYHHLAVHDLPCCFGMVEQQHYASHVGQALAYYGHAQFPVWQMVWSDRAGRFPWQKGFEERLRTQQRLLFEPRHYPLLAHE